MATEYENTRAAQRAAENKAKVDAIVKKIKFGLKIGGAVIGGFLALSLILGGFSFIPTGNRGVVTSFGGQVEKRIMDEGLNFKIPWVQKSTKVDVQINKKQVECAAVSKDLQTTHSIIAINYHVIPTEVNWVYQQIGLSYHERIVEPALQEIVKATTAKYPVVDLIAKREMVKDEIKLNMKAKLLDYKLFVDNLSIVDFKFSKQFSDAIEEKQTAEQNALTEKNNRDKAKFLADQKIEAARGEAEALRLQKMNVSPELIELRKVERDVAAIKRWNGVLPIMTGGVMPFINSDTLIGQAQEANKAASKAKK